MFNVASCVNILGLEVESLEKVRIDQIYQDCELRISGILLTVDLRVMDLSDLDVILGMKFIDGTSSRH